KVKDGRVVDYVIITNAGGNTKYKVGDVVEAGDVGADKGEPGAGGRRRRGLEYEPYSYYLSAWEEDQYIIAQANAAVDEKGKFTTDRVNSRQAGNFILPTKDKVDFIDVSPKSTLSLVGRMKFPAWRELTRSVVNLPFSSTAALACAMMYWSSSHADR